MLTSIAIFLSVVILFMIVQWVIRNDHVADPAKQVGVFAMRRIPTSEKSVRSRMDRS